MTEASLQLAPRSTAQLVPRKAARASTRRQALRVRGREWRRWRRRRSQKTRTALRRNVGDRTSEFAQHVVDPGDRQHTVASRFVPQRQNQLADPALAAGSPMSQIATLFRGEFRGCSAAR